MKNKSCSLVLGFFLLLTSSGCHEEEESNEAPDSELPTAIVNTGSSRLYYSVVPNTDGRYPTEIPVLENDNRQDFDWQRYVKNAQSEGDRAFRANISTSKLAYSVPGGAYSNNDEMVRYGLAAKEYEENCDDLLRRFRLKLKDEAELLALINEFDAHRRKAIALHVRFVGGSWEGGSGARVAYSQARMKAYINYLRELEAVRESLHLQDLPE